jgi:hypothetical protein
MSRARISGAAIICHNIIFALWHRVCFLAGVGSFEEPVLQPLQPLKRRGHGTGSGQGLGENCLWCSGS